VIGGELTAFVTADRVEEEDAAGLSNEGALMEDLDSCGLESLAEAGCDAFAVGAPEVAIEFFVEMDGTFDLDGRGISIGGDQCVGGVIEVGEPRSSTGGDASAKAGLGAFDDGGA
jgi:hypothetical protein